MSSVDFKGRPAVRAKTGCWKSSAFIIGGGVAERLSYYGISSNLVSYLSGALGQPTATAAAELNAWFGASSLLPILGGFLADSFTGRFRMIIVSCLLYILPSRKEDSHLVYKLLEPINLRTKMNMNVKQRAHFNWWTCFYAGGILVPLFILTYIQENVSWVLGFGIPAIVMLLALLLFLSGSATYRFRVTSTHVKNPFLRIYRVFIKAAKNWKAAAPVAISTEEEAQGILPQKSAQFRFLDKALLAPDGSINEKTCSVADVEDAKSLLRLAPIWFACLGYSIIYAQPSTLFTKQAATIDRHITGGFQLPAASLQQCFISVTVTVSLVLYDRVFVPAARAITNKPSGISMLQRIGTGLFLSSTSIVIAAFVERKRLALAREYGLVDMPNATIPMGVWWLAPQYVLSAASDVFAMVGLQEFFYDEVPSELKSIGLAMYLSILGVGSLLSSFLVSSIQKLTSGKGQDGWFANNLNRAHLDYFYLLLAGISAAGFAGFVCFNRSYVYRRRINI
ncbi:UNVERIFIED_CONTAM: protein NRT1/ PTR FAMILY 5.10 [Sesamum calycinum]|uniref:Protein NRT1/ PTR FAMILY 5.10 n=1 Tax=Sesamum calycinum TaxID=2727403 RepID=A0AAW2P5L7_9LAMI